jgi:1-aminocyclopropane-1-carboxylate deaminase/D-cysteine desulfhydrase-like pyridoxal-dependent ACC family enzyme
MLSKEELLSRLKEFPRIQLAVTPTPLEPLPRLSAAYGRRMYVKRDDQLGPGMGGNKTRKLEFLLGEAVQKNFRRVVTFGGLQSNHARITAAAANRCGLETHLFYFEPPPTVMEGNLLLNQVLGARMHFLPLGSGGGMTLENTIRLVRLLAWLRLGPHYFIPVGGHCLQGCLGYVRAAAEIEAQAREMGIENARLVLAAGTGGTLAGLMAGLALLDSSINLLGIDVGKLWKGFPTSIARLAGELCAVLGSPQRFQPGEAPIIESRYAGERYGVPSAAGMEAMEQAAQLEGLLLDPIYTAKAFGGMLDLLKRGELGQDEAVIFLHTGGAPALFLDSLLALLSERSEYRDRAVNKTVFQ